MAITAYRPFVVNLTIFSFRCPVRDEAAHRNHSFRPFGARPFEAALRGRRPLYPAIRTAFKRCPERDQTSDDHFLAQIAVYCGK
jgi:hypothetical protein